MRLRAHLALGAVTLALAGAGDYVFYRLGDRAGRDAQLESDATACGRLLNDVAAKCGEAEETPRMPVFSPTTELDI